MSGGPACADPLPISWSLIRNHLECKAKGKLVRENKSTVTDRRPYFHGIVVDIAMRRYLSLDGLSAEHPESGWMRRYVDEIFAESEADRSEGLVRWKDAGDRAETLAYCRELVARLEEILAVYCLPFDWEPAWRFQVPWTVPYRGEQRAVLIRGEIDLMCFDTRDERDRIAVWDLKATANNDYYKKVIGQLCMYALALRLATRPRLGRWPVRCGLIQPMCDQRVLPVTVDAAARRGIMNAIVATAADYWDGNLAPKKDNKGCDWCEVRRLCPKFRVPGGRGRMNVPAA